MVAASVSATQTDHRIWMLTGASTGAVAGLSFVAFKITMAAILGSNILMPLRLIGAMVLGEQALRLDYPILPVLLAGLGVHMVLSVVYGAAFATVFGVLPLRCQCRAMLVLTGIAMGLFLWIVNLHFFAPLLFPWFTNTVPVVEIAARVVFFGLPVGLLLTRCLSSTRADNAHA